MGVVAPAGIGGRLGSTLHDPLKGMVTGFSLLEKCSLENKFHTKNQTGPHPP